MSNESKQLLREALGSIPRNCEGSTKEVKDIVYEALYYGLSWNGEYLSTLFPKSDKSKLPQDYNSIIAKLHDHDHVNGASHFYNVDDSDVNPIHTGRPCSRKFRQGEAIYRCTDCGFDDTCVLCSYCFNPVDHQDHSVIVSIASASNEGICDCKDPEAWKNPIHCKCDEKAHPNSDFKLDSKLKDAFKNTIEVVLDYIIEVMIHQNHTLPRVHDSFKSSYNLELKIRDASDQSTFQDVIDSNTAEYCLVLWNDEFHNYPDATSRIQAVLNCDSSKAQEVATEVDKEGRTVLISSVDINELVSAYYVVQRTGLTATIHSRRDIIKQEIAKYMVSWLDHLIKFPIIEVQNVLRKIYCEVLTSSFNYHQVREPYFLESSEFNTDIELHAFRDGLLTNENKIPRGGLTKFAKSEYEIASLKNSLKKLLTEETDELSNSRLQYLLYFDIRFWKKIRKAIQHIITPVLVADLSFKPVFASQFVEIYPHLINNMANLDREWLLNFLNDATVQLFTCPKTSLSILQEGKLIKILSPIIELFEKNRSVVTDTGDILWKKRDVISGVDHHARAVLTTQRKSLRDILQLIEHPSFTEKHLCLFKSENIILLILFMKRFQSNWKIKRKEGEHVLRESKEFVTYFEFNTLIYELVKAIGQIALTSQLQGHKSGLKLIENSISILNSYLQLNHSKEKWIDQGNFNIPEFRVSKQEVGFMNPLNSLLSYLIEFAHISDFNLLNKKVTSFSLTSTQVMEGYSDFLRISDVSLRSLVLCSQIKMGFWVRNGVLVGRQEALYRGSLLSETGLFRDIHLEQISVMVEPSAKRSLFNFLDRYDLLNWFLNKEDLEKTVYEDKVFYAFEEFISFLYNIYVYRLTFRTELTQEEKDEIKIKNLISYSLCLGPSSYSELAENFPHEAISHPKFEALLGELSTYTPPQGLNDTGLYRLKHSLFKTLDPLSIFIDSSDSTEVSNSIRQELAHGTKMKSDQIVLNPEIAVLENPEMANNFKRVADFFRTQHFVKLLYKLLQTAIDTDNESFLPVLLHLIHAIVLDDQFDKYDDRPLKAFNDIPIPNLLLTISESTTIAKSNVKKADHILDLFVLKDENVVQSLKDCFGEDHIQSYKAMKAENGGGFETREEKKKRLAKERAEKIKRKFQKQQNKFAANNDVSLKPLNEVDDEGDVSMKLDEEPDSGSSLRSCILCQMEESNTEIFGYPCYVNKSAVFWQLPTEDEAYCKLGLNDWSDQTLMDETELSYGKELLDDINKKKRKRTDSRESNHFHDNFIYQNSEDDEEGMLDEGIEAAFDEIPEEEELDEQEPVEVIFDEQFVDDHGNFMSQTPPGMHNYISSMNPSRRDSFAEENFNVRFGGEVSQRYVASSCGHGMHYKCFKQYVKKPTSFNLGFQCPLCRSLNNLFIPSFISQESHIHDKLKGPSKANKYNQIVSEHNGGNSQLFSNSMLNPELLRHLSSPDSDIGKTLMADITQILKENEALEYIYSDATNYFANIQSLSILIGNTVQMNEITSRFTEKSEDMNSIELANNQSQLLKSMIQFRSLVGSLSDKLVEPIAPLNIEYENLWQERFLNVGSFTELCMLIFQCDESVQTLIRLATTKLFTIVLDSLLERCSHDEFFLNLICINGDDVADRSENLTGLKNLVIEEMASARGFSDDVLQMVVEYDPPASEKMSNSFLIGLQQAITRCVLPFYRQLFIFFKIIDPEFQFDETRENLPVQKLVRSQISMMSKSVGVEDLFDLPDTLLVKTKELELNVFENVLRSKIPKFLEEGILTLDYPGVIKLIDLPSNLNNFLRMYEPSSSGLQLQYSLCLLCGEKVHMKTIASLSHNVIKHFCKECDKSSGLLCIMLNPFNNIFSIILQLQTTQSAIAALQGHNNRGKVFKYGLPSPYLNKHGESNFRGGSFNGILNENRYNELTKLWLNQGIYAFLSRMAMDSRNMPAFNDLDPFTTGIFVTPEEDDDDVDDTDVRW